MARDPSPAVPVQIKLQQSNLQVPGSDVILTVKRPMRAVTLTPSAELDAETMDGV